MTSKALKLLLKVQAKSAGRFIGIYALVIVILLILTTFVDPQDTSWIPTTTIYAPKIYILVMGIVYPLIATKLYVSQGLTRNQFFWAYTGAMSILSLFLLIPILASELYAGNLSLIPAMTHYIQLPLFFLIGWTAIVGFQMRKWYTSMCWLLGAIVLLNCLSALPQWFALSEISTLGVNVSLVVVALIVLPRVISRIPIKS